MLFAKPRVRTHKERTLDYLVKKGFRGATTSELIVPHVGGHRLSAYIKELRKDGYNIAAVRINNYEWRYYLDQYGEK